jgi:hypothetical protein
VRHRTQSAEFLATIASIQKVDRHGPHSTTRRTFATREPDDVPIAEGHKVIEQTSADHTLMEGRAGGRLEPAGKVKGADRCDFAKDIERKIVGQIFFDEGDELTHGCGFEGLATGALADNAP